MDPDDYEHDYDDQHAAQQDIHEELADWNDSWAASNEDGWFYSDD